jgi:predicted nucleic-acid-binding protein
LVRAVDTNVPARALMRDDPVQTPIADAILRDGAYVSLTVLLELAWLLRSRYAQSRARVIRALLALADMPNVVVEEAAGVRWALGQLQEDGDIADLIHLVACRGARSFATFDTGVAPAAGTDSIVPVETL